MSDHFFTLRVKDADPTSGADKQVTAHWPGNSRNF
jgi:hypothetical protein